MEQLPRNTRRPLGGLEGLRSGKQLRFKLSRMIMFSVESPLRFINKSETLCPAKWQRPLHRLLLNISSHKIGNVLPLVRHTFPFLRLHSFCQCIVPGNFYRCLHILGVEQFKHSFIVCSPKCLISRKQDVDGQICDRSEIDIVSLRKIRFCPFQRIFPWKIVRINEQVLSSVIQCDFVEKVESTREPSIGRSVTSMALKIDPSL